MAGRETGRTQPVVAVRWFNSTGGLWAIPMPEQQHREHVPVLFTAYEEDAELDVDYQGEDPTVENHDELVNSGQTYDEIRMMSREDVEEFGLREVTPESSLWCDEVAALDPGEAVRVSELRS